MVDRNTGKLLGTFVGRLVVGCKDGSFVTIIDGLMLETVLGDEVDAIDEVKLGVSVGVVVDGEKLGIILDGEKLGKLLGLSEGEKLGTILDGEKLGSFVGLSEWVEEGAGVGSGGIMNGWLVG